MRDRDPLRERSTLIIWLLCGAVLLGVIVATVCRAYDLAAAVPAGAFRFDVSR